MRPFYLILTTFADGQMAASDPQFSLDGAADEFAEAEKLNPASRCALYVETPIEQVVDVTRVVEHAIEARMTGRNAA